MCTDRRLALGPEIAVGDLQQVPGRVVEVERPHAVVPFDLLEDRPLLVGYAPLPALVVVRPRDEAGVDRAPRAMWRRSRLSGRKVGFEEKQQAVAHAKRQTAAADSPETKNLPVEPAQLLFLAGRVVENRFENAFESHGSTVLKRRISSTGGCRGRWGNPSRLTRRSSVVWTKRAERLGERGLVLVARLELTLLDPQRLREAELEP